MMFQSIPLSVIIIVKNECDRIEDCLKSVHTWVNEIIVVDSFSEDSTMEIAVKYATKTFQNKFINYGNQKNFALSKTTAQWVFSIDADERVSDELKNEIIKFINNPKSNAARINRKSFYLNRWILHGGWYPDIIVRLFKRELGKFTEPMVHEEILVKGDKPLLKGDLIHIPFRNLHHQIHKNTRYALEGSQALRIQKKNFSIFMLIFKPISKFIECYIIKLGFLDRLAGFIIAINAAHSVFLKWSFLYYENTDR